MDTQMLEDVGVAQVRRSTLELYGNGVLVGMIDTGIDYEHQHSAMKTTEWKIKTAPPVRS